MLWPAAPAAIDCRCGTSTTRKPRVRVLSSRASRPLRPNMTALAGLNSRHEKIHSVGFEWTPKKSRDTQKMSYENVLEPANRKTPPGLQTHRRPEAAYSRKS